MSFRPVDAAYSTALDRIVLISATPNQLHIYNPLTQADQIVGLSEVPLNLSISPDGTHAAVAYSDAVSYIDLQAASVLQTYSSLAVGTGHVIFGSGYIYVFPTLEGNILCINLASGVVTTVSAFYQSGGVFDPLDSAIYTSQDGESPESIYRFDASAGVINGGGTEFPYFGVFSVCGQLTLSHDGATIYTACGTVFRASLNTAQDMRYLGILPGVSNSQSIDTSASLNQVAVIPLLPNGTTGTANGGPVVDIFNASYLTQVGQFATTPFVVNSNSYPAHGRWVFYNSSSTNLLIITQADPTAGLELDYAVETVSLTDANSCSATFAASSASVAAPGSYATAQINSPEHCVFTATSNASWISLSSGFYGSGNTTLTYLVRPNLTSSPRSGSISLGSQTFTVTQSAAASPTDLNPLSFKPVAADYDKPLDKIVMVSSSPNELHVYDPITQADQIVPLGFTPLSVSVRPDGLFAAVGHSGNLSYVDLQGLVVTKVIPVDMDIAGILLAGNGYAYAFPSQITSFTDLNSVQIATGTLTGLYDTYYGNIPRLYADGNSIYVSSYEGSSKLDISAGPARLIASEYGELGGNIWLSEDGNRLFNSGGSVYFTSVIPAQDLAPDGKLSGAPSGIAWAANSVIQHQTAVLLADSTSGSAVGTQLQVYADNGLTLLSQLAMPSFTANSTSYIPHGRYLFWNSAATKLFAITEADSSSGLLSDYAEYTVEAPQTLPACTYSLSPNVLNVGPTYAYGIFANVSATCSWTATIPNDTWLYGENASGAAGAGQLALTISQNTGPARSATITIGNQTLTINQADSSCTYTLSSTSQTFSQLGGSGSFSIATGAGCAWSVQTTYSWITIANSSQSGTGPATIQFSVAPNSIPANSLYGSIVVAGSATYSITQAYTPVSPALTFVPVTPCRVVDTRTPSGAPYIAANTTRTVNMPASSCNIPSTAAAYSLNVTVVPHHGLSFLTVYPAGQSLPYVSTLNSDGRVKANAAIVPAGTNGGVAFYATDDTELVLDIDGYFVAASSNSGLDFYTLTPCRVSDTRNPTGALGGPAIQAGQSRDLPVLQSSCGIPSSAQAYSLNFTAVPPVGLSYLSVWPTGQPQPLVSTLNASTVTANAALVPAGGSGSVSVYASDRTDLVVDVDGYFAPPTTPGLHLYTVPPCRVYDSRVTANGSVPFTGVISVPVANYCYVPSGAAAAVVNATVVPQQSLGFLSLWPTGSTQPLVSTLNADDEAITSNMAIVPLGTAGFVSAYASGLTHLILDVSGYFAP